jgi:predicted transcriptional regulator
MEANEKRISEIANMETEKRFTLLSLLYELSDGNPLKPIYTTTLLQRANLNGTEHQNSLNYLEMEGLISYLSDEGTRVSITHQGRNEIEQIINHPKQDTEHFSTQIIQNFHGDNYGAVQAGGQGNTQNVMAQIQSPIDEAFVHLIEDLQQSQQLSDFQKEDALQATESLKKLTEKKDEPGILERAKQKFEQIKSIVEPVKSVYEQVAPYLFTIAQYFNITLDSVIK